MKLRSIIAFGAGYVLGSKAGRERYAQIVEAAQRASKRLEAYADGKGAGPRPDATRSGDTQPR